MLLVITLIAAFLPATFAVQCYTCSWSPKDAPNRTVMCSDEFFEGNALGVSDCDNGCQTYVHTDGNGAVEQLRRSCLQADEEMTGECVTEENKAFSSRRCTCNHDLCNAAAAPVAALLLLLLSFLAAYSSAVRM
ncbi:protein quiver [Caerostris darwini]|uniref:Protein quiver n=1 Tax=Caerostris darwini TaxID=1538125 RepID=A0AAV4W6N7_9ARAC|nr:protein quiver [Caerostris darwini]